MGINMKFISKDSESIIASAVRTLCKSFAAILGIVIGIVLIFMGLSFFSTPDIYPPKSTLTISPNATGNRDLLSHTAPVILKIDITGVIGLGDLTSEKVINSLLDSREGILAGNRVKAILLYMDTPGGTTTDSDTIYRALMDYKKKYQVPIFAYVDGMCASGGMYITSAADKIFANPTSVIGSIGVLAGPTFNFSGLMDKYGVQSLTITQGKDKDMLNPFRPWKPEEDASLQTIVDDLYQQFVSIVTAAHPRLDKDKLVNTYGAQVFIASKAQELGYIDVANSSYSAAVEELASQAKLTDNQFYQVMTIAPPHPFLAGLAAAKLDLLSGKVTHQFQVSSLPPELEGRLLYLYTKERI